MEITRINSGLPTTTKIEQLNDFILQLKGLVESGKFDVNELTQLFTDVTELPRKFLRNVSLGHTLSDYGNWSHVHAESGYGIWKIAPSNFVHNLSNKLYFDNKIVDNRGAAQSEALSSFDSVFLFNGASSTYIDNTTEAGTEGGTSFQLMDAANDYFYFGDATQFSGVSFEFDQRGSNYTLIVQYWNGSTWTTMTANDNTLLDDTSGFLGDGRITWSNPTDWATTSVNGQTKYWIRISTTTVPTTIAKPFLVVPADSVISLLQLSTEEFFAEEWAWCSYNGYVYVTIRNTGATAYEGNYHLTSSSSVTNKKNFFIYNHEYKIDYQNSNYVSTAATLSIASGQAVVRGSCVYISGVNTLSLATATLATKYAMGVCVNAVSGSVAIKNYGRVMVKTVGNADIVAGDRLFLSIASGKVTRTANESGYVISQLLGVALTNEASGEVDMMLTINYNPIEVA